MLLVDGIHHNIAPVDCLDVAEGQVLLNLHPALEDVDEAVEAHRLHVLHLIDQCMRVWDSETLHLFNQLFSRVISQIF